MIIENQKGSSKEKTRYKNSCAENVVLQNALSDDWLNSQPKSRLIEVIKVLAKRLEGERTEEIAKTDLPEIIRGTSSGISPQNNEIKSIVEEIIVPVAKESQLKNPEFQWELTLIPKESSHRPLRIKILGDFTIGRNEGSKSVDLDLTALLGDKFGVSRQHAAIRVTEEGLYLVELGSTNGTFYRGKQLEPGNPVQIFEHGSIAFGGLLLYIGKIQKLNLAN